MDNYTMVIAGFGGQGVLFTGKVLAYAGLIGGKEVSWLPSYGPEMRGGTANCSVCVSDEPIGSPLVTQPDILLVMNGPSYDKFIGAVKPGGTVVVDSTLVQRACPRRDVTVVEIAASRLAGEENLEGIANMILLGRAMAATGIAGLPLVEKALEKCVPPSKAHLREPNLRAVKLGMACADGGYAHAM